MKIDMVEVAAAFMVLFAIIDITGSIPIIIDIKSKGGKVEPMKASIVAFIIFLAFLFLGEPVLGIFGVDIYSFAIAGSLIVFFLGLEMVMGHTFFKHDPQSGTSTIIPIAFPLVAGAGSITTILSLKAEYELINITIALLLNIIIVYIVLRATRFFEKLLGHTGLHILRKAFGIILIAIAIKLFLTNTGIRIEPQS